MCILKLLVCLLIIVVIVYACFEDYSIDSFSPFYRCNGPCYNKGERDCCRCPRCSWFIDRNYNGMCIQRGSGPDSCLNRRYYSSTYPNRYWYHPSNWAFWNSRQHKEESCLVKDSWGRCIEPATEPIYVAPRTRRHNRRRGRHRSSWWW